MSTLYLLDAHNAIVASSRITDVQVDPDGAENLITGATVNGSFPVFIPTEIAIGQVSTVTELNTAKYTNLLALHPEFTYIAYDDLLDASSFDLTNSSSVQVGDRVSTRFGPLGVLQSNSVALSATPNDAIIIWEVFEIVETVSNNRVLLTLNELDPSTLTVEASFDGGTLFQTYLNGVLKSIPVYEQGSSLVMRFTSTTIASRYLASWAVLY